MLFSTIIYTNVFYIRVINQVFFYYLIYTSINYSYNL